MFGILLLVMHYYMYYNKWDSHELKICKDHWYILNNVNICFVSVLILYVYYTIRFLNIHAYEVNH